MGLVCMRISYLAAIAARLFLGHCLYANALTAVIIAMFTMLRLFTELCKFIRHCWQPRSVPRAMAMEARKLSSSTAVCEVKAFTHNLVVNCNFVRFSSIVLPPAWPQIRKIRLSRADSPQKADRICI
jgi:hypothetical protein